MSKILKSMLENNEGMSVINASAISGIERVEISLFFEMLESMGILTKSDDFYPKYFLV